MVIRPAPASAANARRLADRFTPNLANRTEDKDTVALLVTPTRYQRAKPTCNARPDRQAAGCHHASGTGPRRYRADCRLVSLAAVPLTMRRSRMPGTGDGQVGSVRYAIGELLPKAS